MSNEYIILEDSSSNQYYFRVLFPDGGYRPLWHKIQNMQLTVTGKVDMQVGPVLRQWTYSLMVSDSETGNYGDMSDLRTLYQLNDPDGTPSNLLTLTDHYGNTHDVYLMGDMIEEPMSPKIEGSCAWFRVTIRLAKSEAE